jgi:F-type H+-transporting ATPase subunit delta
MPPPESALACLPYGGSIDPESLSVAEVYAEGLLEALGGDERAAETADELDRVAEILREQEGARELLTGPDLGVSESVDLVERLFAGRVNEAVESLLAVMAQHGRLALLDEVARQFRGRVEARQGKVPALAISAVELDDTQREKVRESLSRALGAPVVLTTAVDPNVLGGLVVQVGDSVFDASVAGELKGLREMLAPRQSPGGAAGGGRRGREERQAW